MNSIAINKKTVAVKTLVLVLSVIGAVILPQIFHFIGLASGVGASVGVAFLPMHIPVLLAGFIGGPVAGVAAGILSPIVSFGISGMPAKEMLLLMVLELGAYGLTAGLLSKVKMNSFIKLIIAQLSGRAVRAVAILFAGYVLGMQQYNLQMITSFITAGLFGIILQWAFIPFAADRVEGIRKLYE